MWRNRIFLLAVVLSGLVYTPVDAGWNEFWHRVKVDYHRNKMWPEPFIGADRGSVHDALAIQVDAGWQRQHTLAGFLFDPATEDLTPAGRRKLYWIITQAPPQRRTIYVLDAGDEEVTAKRIDAVQQAIARYLPSGPLPEVVRTQAIPPETPAEIIDDINRRAMASRPDPVLPSETDTIQ